LSDSEKVVILKLTSFNSTFLSDSEKVVILKLTSFNSTFLSDSEKVVIIGQRSIIFKKIKNMSWILYLLIVLWAFFGILALIFPKKAKDLSLKTTRSVPYLLWGIIALIIAFLLWQSAGLVSTPLLIQILAVLAGIKGLFLLVFPRSKTDAMLNYWTNVSDVFYRVFGIVLLILAYYIFQILI